MQLILQATHGIVSGAPLFFKRAFGDSVEEFYRLLARPQHFLFNRVWYDELGGRAEFEDFDQRFRLLGDSSRNELLSLLSSAVPSEFEGLQGKATMAEVKSILHYYVPPAKDEEAKIWEKMRAIKRSSLQTVPAIPADELVEDANLAEVE
jgi:hypothetical protein